MRFCRGKKCYWYSHEKRGRNGRIVRRKCYYEPGCPLGWLDYFFSVLKIALRHRSGCTFLGIHHAKGRGRNEKRSKGYAQIS